LSRCARCLCAAARLHAAARARVQPKIYKCEKARSAMSAENARCAMPPRICRSAQAMRAMIPQHATARWHAAEAPDGDYGAPYTPAYNARQSRDAVAASYGAREI
jgi:hypothetical protein